MGSRLNIGPIRTGRKAMSGLLAVQPVAQKLAGLEERHFLVIDFHGLARAGIAAHAGVARLDRKGPGADPGL